VYVCVVHNPGVSLNPVSYQLHLEWEYNQTTLNAGERKVAQQLFDRWAGGWGLPGWLVYEGRSSTIALLSLSWDSARLSNQAVQWAVQFISSFSASHIQ